MLRELHVENFALIDRLDIRIEPGLTVLTGETGAGKSIIVDAINAVLGERTPSECVREGCERARVQASFDVADKPQLAAQLREIGLEPGSSLSLSREIQSNGRTQCRVNGRLVSLGALREMTPLLADVHGQHEHQLLLSPAWQLEYLDSFAGAEVGELRQQYSRVWSRLQSVSAELGRLSTDARERERLMDLYRFQVSEIEAAELVDGEEEALAEEALRLAHLEKLFLAGAEASSRLSGEESDSQNSSPGATAEVAQGLKALEAVETFDGRLGHVLEPLRDAAANLEEAADRLRSWRDELEVSPERIDQVQARLDLIGSLKRKYGETISEILAYLDRTARELQGLETSGERREELGAEQAALLEEARAVADRLTDGRQRAAEALCGCVEAELGDLGMKGARFEVALQVEDLGATGQDRVEFLFSANPGESPRPLSRVASGGEASRTMLALKTVLTAGDPVGTLVFDEIDAGIGGMTANVVGEKLRGLASGRQVLSVTHLPQIARFAHNHLLVEKGSVDGSGTRTVICVRELNGEDRVTELARMLGGDESEAAVQHARELLGAGGRERV